MNIPKKSYMLLIIVALFFIVSSPSLVFAGLSCNANDIKIDIDNPLDNNGLAWDCTNFSNSCGNTHAVWFANNRSCWLNKKVIINGKFDEGVTWKEDNISIVVNITTDTEHFIYLDNVYHQNIVNFSSVDIKTAKAGTEFSIWVGDGITVSSQTPYALVWNGGNIEDCGFGTFSDRYCIYMRGGNPSDDIVSYFNNVTWHSSNSWAFYCEGWDFFGSRLGNGFIINNSQFFGGTRAITLNGCYDVTIENTLFDDTGSSGIITSDDSFIEGGDEDEVFKGCNNLLVKNVTIDFSGVSKNTGINIGDKFGEDKTLVDIDIINVKRQTAGRGSIGLSVSGVNVSVENVHVSGIGGTLNGCYGTGIVAGNLNDSTIKKVDCDDIGNSATGGGDSYCLSILYNSFNNHILDFIDWDVDADGSGSSLYLDGDYNIIDFNYWDVLSDEYFGMKIDTTAEYNQLFNINCNAYNGYQECVWLYGGTNNLFYNVSMSITDDRTWGFDISGMDNNTIVNFNCSCSGSCGSDGGLCDTGNEKSYCIAHDFWGYNLANGLFKTTIINGNYTELCFESLAGGDEYFVDRRWYVNWNVSNMKGNLLLNANVSVENNTGLLEFWDLSPLDYVINLTDYVQNITDIVYYDNYTINASKKGYSSWDNNFNLSTNIFWDINLTRISGIAKYFINYEDENYIIKLL